LLIAVSKANHYRFWSLIKVSKANPPWLGLLIAVGKANSPRLGLLIAVSEAALKAIGVAFHFMEKNHLDFEFIFLGDMRMFFNYLVTGYTVNDACVCFEHQL
jgi:hypothetical protein